MVSKFAVIPQTFIRVRGSVFRENNLKMYAAIVVIGALTLCTLSKISADDMLKYFFFF